MTQSFPYSFDVGTDTLLMLITCIITSDSLLRLSSSGLITQAVFIRAAHLCIASVLLGHEISIASCGFRSIRKYSLLSVTCRNDTSSYEWI